MKFTLAWLRDHLDTSASLDDISKTLTAVGLEVESITDHSAALKRFTVAKILSAEKHPEADKLRVCRVESDAGELQIVCGAPNARAGILVALAKEGAIIPGNGMTIKKTKIRGVESNGMLCSADELGLALDSEGIIELPQSAQVGAPVAAALGLDDPVIEIAITPNRADCLGVRGIARDLAAAGLGTLKSLADISTVQGSFPSPIHVTIDDETCQQFIGCTLQGLINGPSPDWLQNRLRAIGLRPISTLVDITNYFTFDLGRPLHVYDIKKLQSSLVVRKALPGEKLQALNGKAYTLDASMTVIADAGGALAIGGIIGGGSSGCDEQTTDVFLEVALFEPASIAQAGRKLQIDSDARYRFERGVDVDFVEEGALRAIKMITELCGGSTSALTLAGHTPSWQRSFRLREERIAGLGGVAIAAADVERILTQLGFSIVPTNGGWDVMPPSWRRDVDGEADIIEECLRIVGYDNIPATPLAKLPGISKAALNLAQKRAHLARRLLATRGSLEVCTWSFLPQAHAELFGGHNPKLRLLNPINAELDTMRPSLLPNLLTAAQKNAFRGQHALSLFEVGLQFHDIGDAGQRLAAASLRMGDHTRSNYAQGIYKSKDRAVDAFDAKGDALALLQSLGLNKCDITAKAPAWYHPGRSGSLTLGGKIILGHFGEIHPYIAKHFAIDQPIVACELFLDSIPAPRAKSKAKPALTVSDYQTVERDFAFIVGADVTAADILKALAQADKQWITDVAIFDVYTGTGVEAGKKSVAVKVTLQAADRTLSETDIATVSNAIVAAAKGFGGVLRQ